MTEYAVARSSKHKANEAVHILLNLMLGIFSVFLTVLSGNPALSIILVIASKWRVFAVRWRYLFFNIRANIIDFVVGLSIVALTYIAGSDALAVDIILAVIYSIWLIAIKPISSERGALIQGLIAVFLGATAISEITATTNEIVPTILAYILGYAVSRHVYNQSEESDFELITHICGLVFAEITLLCHIWNIIYTIEIAGSKLQFSQLAVILTVLTLVYDRIRVSIFKYDNHLKISDIIAPIVYGIVIIVAAVLWFSNPIFNI